MSFKQLDVRLFQHITKTNIKTLQPTYYSYLYINLQKKIKRCHNHQEMENYNAIMLRNKLYIFFYHKDFVYPFTFLSSILKINLN